MLGENVKTTCLFWLEEIEDVSKFVVEYFCDTCL